MRLLLLRFDAAIRVARAPFYSRVPRAVVSLRNEREGRRRRRTSEGGFPLGCLRLFWSRSDDADGGARQRDTTVRVASAGWRAFTCPSSL